MTEREKKKTRQGQGQAHFKIRADKHKLCTQSVL